MSKKCWRGPNSKGRISRVSWGTLSPPLSFPLSCLRSAWISRCRLSSHWEVEGGEKELRAAKKASYPTGGIFKAWGLGGRQKPLVCILKRFIVLGHPVGEVVKIPLNSASLHLITVLLLFQHPQIQKESQYIKYLCCDDAWTMDLWVTGIRIAKVNLSPAVLWRPECHPPLGPEPHPVLFSACTLSTAPPSTRTTRRLRRRRPSTRCGPTGAHRPAPRHPAPRRQRRNPLSEVSTDNVVTNMVIFPWHACVFTRFFLFSS